MLAGQVPIKTWPRDPRTARLVNTEFDHVVYSPSPPRRAPIIVSLSPHHCFHSSTVSLSLSLPSLSFSLARSLARFSSRCRRYRRHHRRRSPSTTLSRAEHRNPQLVHRRRQSHVRATIAAAPRELVVRPRVPARSDLRLSLWPRRSSRSRSPDSVPFGGDVLRNPSERTTSSSNAH